MQIEHLRLFTAIARSLSLTEGARSLGLSQSAASQAVAQLEHALGTRLLDRSRRPLVLTEAGRRFHGGAERLLDGWDRLVAEVRPGEGGELHGSLTVAAIPSLGLHLLSGLVERFVQRHPQVRLRTLHLRHDLVVQAVRQQRADLGILSYPPAQRGLEAVHLRDEPLVAVCHPSHRLVPRRRLLLRDLDGQRLVAFDRDQPVRRVIDRALAAAGVRVEIAMELDNIESMKQAVLNGGGLAILPEPMVLREALGRLLVALPFEDVQLSRPVAAIRRRSAGDPLAEAFIAFARDSTHQQPPTAPVAPVRHGQPSQWD